MRVLAPAKINLYLWVGGRRGDGLHEVESVMQSVSLTDFLDITAAEAVSLDVEPRGAAPEDESNLVVKAVRALAVAAGKSTGASIRLTKHIPAAGGLAGGSADAAATLVGLNRLWSLGLSRKALEKIAAGVGSDVPFCVRGGTAVARGAGESLAPLVARAPLWWVIAKPPGSLSTAEVYGRYDELGGPQAAAPDPSEVADALARGDLGRLAGALRNDLEAAAQALMPELSTARAELLGAGALGAVMSGSGPTWCGLAGDENHAKHIAGGLSRLDRTWIVRSLDRGARVEGK
jgi:4-diphosphocytidyl-2-C-methyl-D-erythritol kinase